ncbi:MAG: cytochrome P450, partial [Cyanobacteria bacterium J06628_3]
MDMFGEYSLFQRPDLHRQRKNSLGPGLTGRFLAGYIPHINNQIKNGLQKWNTSEKIAVYPEVEKICFDVLTPILWGVKLDDEKPESFNNLPIKNKQEVKALYKTYFDGFYGLLKWKSSLTAYGRGIKARAELIEFMRAVIKRRKQTEINPTSDFLAMMLTGQEENPDGVFNNDLIENQCLLEMWASYYQISALVASFIYQLGKYPEFIKKLRQEQSELIKEKDISSELLKQMKFLEATIKETLRISPPSSTANRRLMKSVVLNGILYKKGCTVMAEPRLAHIRKEYFTNPDKFEPERFLAPRNEGKMYEFIPFGGGVHACLGAQMAMVITKIFAINLLNRFDWESTGEADFVQFPLKKIKDNYIELLLSIKFDNLVN